MEETRGLVEALDCECAYVDLNRIRDPNASVLFGSGQLDQHKQQLRDQDCSLFVVDGDLTPVQQRNLEERLGVKVIDRTALILEIFGLRARSAEGRLQVEAARLAYERSRLVRTWTHLERQRGGVGFVAGPGESQLEADRRMLDRVIKKLNSQLADVRRTRGVQRAGRSRRETPVIALVGYTNAGKSTLFNTLSSSDVLAKDMPFATLDPTIREMTLERAGRVALVDTVGFITDLPTHLVDSFEATLEEAMEADLLLHVRDIASPTTARQKQDVLTVLDRLAAIRGEEMPPILEVWNKMDQVPADDLEGLRLRLASDPDHPAVLVSAVAGQGYERLLDTMSELLLDQQSLVEVSVQPDQAAALAWLYDHGEVMSVEMEEDGAQRVRARLTEKAIGQFLSRFPDFRG